MFCSVAPFHAAHVMWETPGHMGSQFLEKVVVALGGDGVVSHINWTKGVELQWLQLYQVSISR